MLIDEENADGSYSLFVVEVGRADPGGKQLLDQGGVSSYGGRIVGDRAVFSREIALDPVSGNSIDADLYSVRLDGADLRQLTSGSAIDVFRDVVGDRIVFNRRFGSFQTPSNQDVMSVRLDGSDLRPLAADPTRVESVSRLAGDVVVINSGLITGDFSLSNPDVHAVKADGSAAPVAIATSPGPELVRDVIGERIVFGSSIAGANGSTTSQLFSRQLNGDGLTALADAANEDARYVGHIGERVFIRNKTVSASGDVIDFITSVNADGSDKIAALVPSAFLEKVLADRLIFSRKVNGVTHLFSAAPDGQGEATQLTAGNASPDVAGVVGDTLVISRVQPLLGTPVRDLFALRLGVGGAQEAPLGNSADDESFQGVALGRVVFRRSVLQPNGTTRSEIHSVALDGSGARRLLPDSTGSEFVEAIREDGRVIIRRSLPSADGSANALEQLVAVGIDASNPVLLTDARADVDLLDD